MRTRMILTTVTLIAASALLLGWLDTPVAAQPNMEELAKDPVLFLKTARTYLKWDQPAEPAKLVGPIHFVGTKGLGSFLITGSDGHVLLYTGMPGSGEMIEKSILKLGFQPKDVKIILTGHAHCDHAGGHAYLKRATGAKIAMMREDVELFEPGGKLDFHYGDYKEFAFEPAKVDTVLRDEDEVKLGDITIKALLTPGHTRGSTTYVMTVADGGKKYTVAFPDGTSVNPGYRVASRPSYLGIGDDFRRTFRTLEGLEPNIWFNCHTEFFDYDAKLARAAKEGTAAWVDPEGFKKYIAAAKVKFEATAAKETAAPDSSLREPVGPAPVVDGSTLPFPPTPSASTAGLTMGSSTYKKRVEPRRLAADAPNILIILMDDVGPATPSTYGGEINTPTLSRVAKMGVSYNRFHSTAMCSPTRAALLCGRNHTRVGNGQIAALANDFDGFSGIIPKSSATVAEVLKNYGYNTAAFGKWHNTPEDQITNKGPFEYWPTGYGFEYFYGFLAGEASQYEPTLVRNTTYVNRPAADKFYHLTEDIAEDAIQWLRDQRSYAPDKPFFMYWCPGASHGPHQVMKEWADKYQGKFDDGWDKYRERAFARQKELGWIPGNAKLTPRPETMASWDSIPENEKPFQRRLMEVFAGFTEHADHNAGRLIDEIERQGKLDNTLVFYIWGDNGSSAEGLYGTISEQLAQNAIPTKISQHIDALSELGGLDALGGPKTDNMYHAAWAWAGSTPYRSTKLVGAHFGGTRQPMAVAWPKKIRPDATPRAQFHHVIDLAPTIYEVLNITPPRVVNGVPQDSIDGISMAYTFAHPTAEGRRKTQFFDIMASRGIYHDGWFASAMGPREPWVGGVPKGAKEWSPEKDKWELYNLNDDWSQADDLADKMPEKLAQMKDLFLLESSKNKNLPIGGGLWATALFHPEDAPASPYTAWTFDGASTGMPESTAPKLGKVSSLVSMDVDVPDKANGVLYALAGFSGGITCYVKDGILCYEFNLFEIERSKLRAKEMLPKGRAKIEIESKLVEKIGGPMAVTMKVNGKAVAQGRVPRAMSLHFTSNATFDIGADQDSPVSLDYFDQAPFRFNGTIGTTRITYLK